MNKINIEDLYYVDGVNLPLGADTPGLPAFVVEYVTAMDEKINWEEFHLDTPFYYDVFTDTSNIIEAYKISCNKWNCN